MNRKVLLACAFVSWPLLCALLYFTSSKPGAGERWADANPGRGGLLAATGVIYLTAALLFGVWQLAFKIVLPLLERQRESRTNNDPSKQ